jgi:hypothetical protein
MAKKRAKRRRSRVVLCAQSFYLEDEEGRVRGLLTASGDAAVFQLHDAQQRSRATMQVMGDGSAVLAIMGPRGQTLVGMGANEHGQSIGVNNSDGLPALQATWKPDGGLEIVVFDNTGRPVWQTSQPVFAQPCEASEANASRNGP